MYLPMLAFFGNFIWGLGAVILFFIALLMIAVILIQDSSGGGVGGAFGGGGGESVLGARAQRGITKFTAILGGIFAVLMVLLAKFNPDAALIDEGGGKTPTAISAGAGDAGEGGESGTPGTGTEGTGAGGAGSTGSDIDRILEAAGSAVTTPATGTTPEPKPESTTTSPTGTVR